MSMKPDSLPEKPAAICSNCRSRNTSEVVNGKKNEYICNDCMHRWILGATAPLTLPGCTVCGGQFKAVEDYLECEDCGEKVFDDENTEPVQRVLETGTFDKLPPLLDDDPQFDTKPIEIIGGEETRQVFIDMKPKDAEA